MSAQRNRLLFLAVLVTVLIAVFAAVPAMAEPPFDDTTYLEDLSVIDCMVTVTISYVDAATYTLQIYDDYVLIFSQAFVQGAGPGEFSGAFAVTEPPNTAATGVGVVVFKGNDVVVYQDLLSYTVPEGCNPVFADTQCASNAIIPHGAVVGALPGGGRAYWAPGKITPEVYIYPGHYWIVDAFEDEEGVVWFKLYISCAYLWVPAEWMTTTDDGPWNFEPLPLPSNIPPNVSLSS